MTWPREQSDDPSATARTSHANRDLGRGMSEMTDSESLRRQRLADARRLSEVAWYAVLIGALSVMLGIAAVDLGSGSDEMSAIANTSLVVLALLGGLCLLAAPICWVSAALKNRAPDRAHRS